MLRLTLVAVAWAAAVALGCFCIQIFIWWYVPPISDVSFVYALAPRHAARLSAYVFVVAFVFIFAWRFPGEPPKERNSN
jgi:hypothetical protein